MEAQEGPRPARSGEPRRRPTRVVDDPFSDRDRLSVVRRARRSGPFRTGEGARGVLRYVRALERGARRFFAGQKGRWR
jgi:hypothetical protein